MNSVADVLNAGALALRDIRRKYDNLPEAASVPFDLSKRAPYFGYVDVKVGDCPTFAMFSNNDDFVAKNYFWNGADAYEPMSLKLWLALSKSSVTTFDIGSYTGVYSLAAAKLNPKSKVHAFEALDHIYSRILVNMGVNRLGNMSAHQVAISDKEGTIEFNVYAGDTVLSTGSSIVENQTGRALFQKKPVRTISLNKMISDLEISRLDLMKIDAEGAEHLIFEGGIESIQMHSPDMICEFLKGAKSAEIERMLSSIGYRYFAIDEQAMSVEPVKNIAVGKDMHTLNTLITKKSAAQIEKLLQE